MKLDIPATRGILPKGGTILGSSRTNPFKIEGGVEKIKENLAKMGIDALIAIGGEDTLGVATKLDSLGGKVVGVPKTIDNDLNNTDYTFGFDTSVNIAVEAIDRLHTTAESHHRALIVEVMGRHAGWIALHSGGGRMSQIAFKQEREKVKEWRRYPAYKDSGVEWLGEVPQHWEVMKCKQLSLIKRGASPRPIDDPSFFDDNGAYSWVRISDVTASNKYLETSEQTLSELGKSKSVALEPGELFVSICATVGKPIITNIKCCIHDGFVYFPYLKENREYLFYIFSGGELYKGLGKQGTQLNLNTDTIGDIKLPIPPLPEQQAIAQFLDRETAKIDTLIAKTRNSIEKLKEYRTALISAAVTGKIDVRNDWEYAHYNSQAFKRICSKIPRK